MKEVTFSSLGLTVKVNVPATAEEFDQLAKRPSACVDEANSNIAYRAVLPRFRSVFTEAVEKSTGITRKVDLKELKEKDAEGKPKTTEVWGETEGKYFDGVQAQTGKKASDFQSIADEVAATLVFDPSVKEPTESKPKKPKKALLEKANAVIAAGKADILAQKLAKNLGHEVASDADSLAFAIDEDLQRLAAIQSQKMFGGLGIEGL